jgi:hypothetical protein
MIHKTVECTALSYSKILTYLSSNRFFVPENVFNMLMHSNEGVVDLNIDAELVSAFKERDDMFGAYWSAMDITIISKRIEDAYLRHFYGQGENEPLPTDVIQQKDSFPSRDWIVDFWEMIRSLTREDRKTSLSLLKGIHLLPITQGRLAPLSKDDPVICLNYTKYRQEKTPASQGKCRIPSTTVELPHRGNLCCRIRRGSFQRG